MKAGPGKDSKEGGREGGREKEREEGRVGSHLGMKWCRSSPAQDVLSRQAPKPSTTGRGRTKATASG